MSIYAIPENRKLKVELDCDGGFTMLQTCYQNNDSIDMCKVNTLSNLSSDATTLCEVSTSYLFRSSCDSKISCSRTHQCR